MTVQIRLESFWIYAIAGKRLGRVLVGYPIYNYYYVPLRLALGRIWYSLFYLDYIPRQHVHLQTLARNAYEKVKSLKWDFVEYKVIPHQFRPNKISPAFCTRDCTLTAPTITD